MGAGSQPGVTITACHCAEVLGSVASRATPVEATVTGSFRVAPQAMSDFVTVSVRGDNLSRAGERLQQALVPYADARVIALTNSTNWVTSLLGKTTLLAVIEYVPASPTG